MTKQKSLQPVNRQDARQAAKQRDSIRREQVKGKQERKRIER